MSNKATLFDEDMMNYPFPKCGSGGFVGHCWRVTLEVGQRTKRSVTLGKKRRLKIENPH